MQISNMFIFKRNPIIRTLRHTRRFREIAGILIKYGFSEFLDALKLSRRKGPIGKLVPEKEKVRAEKHSRWQRIRMALEELGPTFIKFGQIVSSRQDLLPAALIEELGKLQDEVPPFPAGKAVAIIEEQLKTSIQETFSDFQRKPEASASIAQVHRARLPDGSSVAVKVRRPGIEEQIHTDLEILENLAELTERYIPTARLFNPRILVQEFKDQINRELDFVLEMLNIEKFQSLLKGEKHLRVPRAYKQLSTRQVLTLEYIPGTRLARILKSPSEYPWSRELTARMADLLLKQVFENGFFHADPHPGNILVLDAAAICYLDFGMMGTISPRQQEQLSTLMFGITRRDTRLLARTLLEMTSPSHKVDRDALEYRAFQILERYIDLPLEHIDIRQIFSDLLDVIVTFRLRMPRNLILMIKTLIMMEGIGRKLDPQFQFIDKIEPYARRLFAQKFYPKALMEELSLASLDYWRLFKELPSKSTDLLEQLIEGRARLNMRFTGLEALRFVLDAVSNRLVFGLILAALLISSSLIVLSGVPPLWRGIPVIGLGGYLVSAIMGIIFIIAWFREKVRGGRSRR